MCIAIVKRSNFERPYLANYWVTNEKLNGFELGHGAPVDCRRFFSFEVCNPNNYYNISRYGRSKSEIWGKSDTHIGSATQSVINQSVDEPTIRSRHEKVRETTSYW